MTTPAQIKLTIYQGATFREPLDRQTIPYEVVVDECGNLTNACTGAAVPSGDITDEDYTGCHARMQLREDIDKPVLLECTDLNGRLILSGKRITLFISDADTSTLTVDSCMGHIEVTRPSGDVERHYEVTFSVSKEGTR